MDSYSSSEYREFIKNALSECEKGMSIFFEYEVIAKAFPSSRANLNIARPPPYANVRDVILWAEKMGFSVIWIPPPAESFAAPPFEFNKI